MSSMDNGTLRDPYSENFLSRIGQKSHKWSIFQFLNQTYRQPRLRKKVETRNDTQVPTWAPFGLQFYCNGHGAVARALKREGIGFVQADNAFLHIADVDRAQAIADALSPDMLHERLDRDARWLCPVLDVFGQTYHWSLRQPGYSLT